MCIQMPYDLLLSKKKGVWDLYTFYLLVMNAQYRFRVTKLISPHFLLAGNPKGQSNPKSNFLWKIVKSSFVTWSMAHCGPWLIVGMKPLIVLLNEPNQEMKPSPALLMHEVIHRMNKLLSMLHWLHIKRSMGLIYVFDLVQQIYCSVVVVSSICSLIRN